MVGTMRQTQPLIARRVKTTMPTSSLLQQQRHPVWMLLAMVATTLALVISSPACINAFTTFIPTHQQHQQIVSVPSPLPIRSMKYYHQMRLASANTDEGTTEQDAAAAVDTENIEVPMDSTAADSDMVTEITATDEVTPEDPEITAMKEEITKMEQDIKSARRQLADLNDRAEDFTKTGYARKVAEMENMRRARSMLQSSNKYTATAALLTEFLPAMDALNALKGRYESNEFGKMYNALPDAIRSGYTSMGCTEYSIETNTLLDPNRMTVIDSEPSTTVPKDAVIRTVLPGMELEGNMIRLAQVVTSLGNADTNDNTLSSSPEATGASE